MPNNSSRHAPARTPEGRENQLISLAIDLAEKQLQEGTASSQVITHFLRLGTERERLEREKLEQENLLINEKINAIRAAERVEELYANAIAAMKSYGGNE
jgi:hypothetical protein